MTSGSCTEASKWAHYAYPASTSDHPPLTTLTYPGNTARVDTSKRRDNKIVPSAVAITSSSSNVDPSPHPLTTATLALTTISSPQDEAERIERIQEAARELGFELSKRRCESDKQDLESWLDAQCDLYGSLHVKDE